MLPLLVRTSQYERQCVCCFARCMIYSIWSSVQLVDQAGTLIFPSGKIVQALAFRVNIGNEDVLAAPFHIVNLQEGF